MIVLLLSSIALAFASVLVLPLGNAGYNLLLYQGWAFAFVFALTEKNGLQAVVSGVVFSIVTVAFFGPVFKSSHNSQNNDVV